MNSPCYLSSLIISFSLFGGHSRADILYDLDFSAPEVGSYTIWGGTPVVVPALGDMSDVLLLKGKTGINSDGISLDFGVKPLSYVIEFDIVTHGLRNSLFGFMLYMNTPQTRNVGMHGGSNTIDVFQPSPYTHGKVQSFSDDVAYHFRIFTDFPNNRWQVSVDGFPLYENVFDAAEISSVAFTLREWRLGAVDDPSILVGLDNIRVEAIPEPSPCLLILFGLALCFRKWIRPGGANPAHSLDGAERGCLHFRYQGRAASNARR